MKRLFTWLLLALVEVEGPVVGGVLIAEEVYLEAE